MDITAESVWTNHNWQQNLSVSPKLVCNWQQALSGSPKSVRNWQQNLSVSQNWWNHSRICFPKCAIAAESISQNQYSIIAESVCQFQYVICNSKLHLVSFEGSFCFVFLTAMWTVSVLLLK